MATLKDLVVTLRVDSTAAMQDVDAASKQIEAGSINVPVAIDAARIGVEYANLKTQLGVGSPVTLPVSMDTTALLEGKAILEQTAKIQLESVTSAVAEQINLSFIDFQQMRDQFTNEMFASVGNFKGAVNTFVEEQDKGFFESVFSTIFSGITNRIGNAIQNSLSTLLFGPVVNVGTLQLTQLNSQSIALNAIAGTLNQSLGGANFAQMQTGIDGINNNLTPSLFGAVLKPFRKIQEGFLLEIGALQSAELFPTFQKAFQQTVGISQDDLLKQTAISGVLVGELFKNANKKLDSYTKSATNGIQLFSDRFGGAIERILDQDLQVETKSAVQKVKDFIDKKIPKEINIPLGFTLPDSDLKTYLMKKGFMGKSGKQLSIPLRYDTTGLTESLKSIVPQKITIPFSAVKELNTKDINIPLSIPKDLGQRILKLIPDNVTVPLFWKQDQASFNLSLQRQKEAIQEFLQWQVPNNVVIPLAKLQNLELEDVEIDLDPARIKESLRKTLDQALQIPIELNLITNQQVDQIEDTIAQVKKNIKRLLQSEPIEVALPDFMFDLSGNSLDQVKIVAENLLNKLKRSIEDEAGVISIPTPKGLIDSINKAIASIDYTAATQLFRINLTSAVKNGFDLVELSLVSVDQLVERITGKPLFDLDSLVAITTKIMEIEKTTNKFLAEFIPDINTIPALLKSIGSRGIDVINASINNLESRLVEIDQVVERITGKSLFSPENLIATTQRLQEARNAIEDIGDVIPNIGKRTTKIISNQVDKLVEKLRDVADKPISFKLQAPVDAIKAQIDEAFNYADAIKGKVKEKRREQSLKEVEKIVKNLQSKMGPFLAKNDISFDLPVTEENLGRLREQLALFKKLEKQKSAENINGFTKQVLVLNSALKQIPGLSSLFLDADRALELVLSTDTSEFVTEVDKIPASAKEIEVVFLRVAHRIENAFVSSFDKIKKSLLKFVEATEKIGKKIQGNLAEASPGPTYQIRKKWDFTSRAVAESLGEIENEAEATGKGIRQSFEGSQMEAMLKGLSSISKAQIKNIPNQLPDNAFGKTVKGGIDAINPAMDGLKAKIGEVEERFNDTKIGKILKEKIFDPSLVGKRLTSEVDKISNKFNQLRDKTEKSLALLSSSPDLDHWADEIVRAESKIENAIKSFQVRYDDEGLVDADASIAEFSKIRAAMMDHAKTLNSVKKAAAAADLSPDFTSEVDKSLNEVRSQYSRLFRFIGSASKQAFDIPFEVIESMSDEQRKSLDKMVKAGGGRSIFEASPLMELNVEQFQAKLKRLSADLAKNKQGLQVQAELDVKYLPDQINKDLELYQENISKAEKFLARITQRQEELNEAKKKGVALSMEEKREAALLEARNKNISKYIADQKEKTGLAEEKKAKYKQESTGINYKENITDIEEQIAKTKAILSRKLGEMDRLAEIKVKAELDFQIESIEKEIKEKINQIEVAKFEIEAGVEVDPDKIQTLETELANFQDLLASKKNQLPNPVPETRLTAIEKFKLAFTAAITKAKDALSGLRQQFPAIDNALTRMGISGKKAAMLLVGGLVAIKSAGYLASRAMDSIGNLIGNFTSQIFEVNKSVGASTAAITFFSENAKQDLAVVNNAIEQYGISTEVALRGFKLLSGAVKGTSINNDQLITTFNAIAQSSKVFGLSTEQSEGALLALSQIASKGVVSMEELRGQLGERIPGAMLIGARSMGLGIEAFNELVESGSLLSEEFLPRFANQLQFETIGGLESAGSSLLAAESQLKNAVTQFQLKIGELITPAVIKGFGLAETALKGMGVILSQLKGIIAGLGLLAISKTLVAMPFILDNLRVKLKMVAMDAGAATTTINGLKLSVAGVAKVIGPFVLSIAAASVATSVYSAATEALGQSIKDLKPAATASTEALNEFKLKLGELDNQVSTGNVFEQRKKDLKDGLSDTLKFADAVGGVGRQIISLGMWDEGATFADVAVTEKTKEITTRISEIQNALAEYNTTINQLKDKKLSQGILGAKDEALLQSASTGVQTLTNELNGLRNQALDASQMDGIGGLTKEINKTTTALDLASKNFDEFARKARIKEITTQEAEALTELDNLLLTTTQDKGEIEETKLSITIDRMNKEIKANEKFVKLTLARARAHNKTLSKGEREFVDKAKDEVLKIKSELGKKELEIRQQAYSNQMEEINKALATELSTRDQKYKDLELQLSRHVNAMRLTQEQADLELLGNKEDKNEDDLKAEKKNLKRLEAMLTPKGLRVDVVKKGRLISREYLKDQSAIEGHNKAIEESKAKILALETESVSIEKERPRTQSAILAADLDRIRQANDYDTALNEKRLQEQFRDGLISADELESRKAQLAKQGLESQRVLLQKELAGQQKILAESPFDATTKDRVAAIKTELLTLDTQLIEATNATVDKKMEDLLTKYSKVVDEAELKTKELEIEAQKGVNAGLISKEEMDSLMLGSSVDRIAGELRLERQKIKELQALEKQHPRLDTESQIRDATQKTLDLTLELLNKEIEARELLNQEIEKSIELDGQRADKQSQAYALSDRLINSQMELFATRNELAKSLAELQDRRITREIEELRAIDLTTIARYKREGIERRIAKTQAALGQTRITNLIREQKQEQLKLEIEEKRSLVESRRSEIEAKRNIIQAQTEILKAQQAGDRDAMILAQTSLALATEELNLVSQERSDLMEINRLKWEQLRATQEIAREDFAREETARRLEISEANAVASRKALLDKVSSMDAPMEESKGISPDVEREIKRQSRKMELGMGSSRLESRLTSLQTTGLDQVKTIIDGLKTFPANDLTVKGLTSIEQQVTKIFQAITGLNALTPVPITIQPTFNNTFANQNQAALLNQVRKQTLEQISSVVSGVVK